MISSERSLNTARRSWIMALISTRFRTRTRWRSSEPATYRMRLTCALDDYADNVADSSLAQRLRTLAREADPDPLRNAVREAVARHESVLCFSRNVPQPPARWPSFPLFPFIAWEMLLNPWVRLTKL